MPRPLGRARRRGVPLTAFVLLLLAIPAFVDTPTRIKPGAVSVMGMLSVVQVALAAVAVIACGSYPRRLLHRVAPYAVFLSWAGVSTLWATPTFGGMQNLVVYVLFGLALLLTGTLAAARPDQVHVAIGRGIGWIDGIGLTLAITSLLLAGLPNDDTQWLVGPRAFALLGLIPLSWHVAHWQAGAQGRLLRAWFWLMAIGLSLSRTALAIAMLYIVAALALQLRPTARSLLLRVPAGALAVGASVMFVLRSGALEERTFTGDTSLEVGSVAINMSGRLSMWPLVISSASESPIIGRGLGTSQEVVKVFDYIGHPHNDYLRIWHDLGAVGLLLLLVSFGVWLWCLGTNWRRAARWGDRQAPMQMAAVFAIVGLLLAAFTDNAIIYPFVMAPLGVLVGAGLGAGERLRAYDEHH